MHVEGGTANAGVCAPNYFRAQLHPRACCKNGARVHAHVCEQTTGEMQAITNWKCACACVHTRLQSQYSIEKSERAQMYETAERP